MKIEIKRILVVLGIILSAGACSGAGCGGCSFEELPPEGLPTDQTIEGGAQIRISESGFETITNIIPAVLGDSLANAGCVPDGDIDPGLGTIHYCFNDDGDCTAGCEINVNVDEISLEVPQDDILSAAVQVDISMDVPARYTSLLLNPAPCTIVATANNLRFDVDINFDINPTTGELELNLEEIDDINIDLDLDASSCGSVIDAIASLVSEIANGLGSILNVGFVRDLLTPVIEPLVQNLLPDPLGVEGVADLSGVVAPVSPGTNATIEARVVPGGYVHLERGGLSLGVITGINADEDLSTRSEDLDSEPALCVPPFAAPNFGAAPHSLTQGPRQNYVLNGADLFRGIPETGRDITIGASETTLDQIGHHLISSGAFCLQIGSELSPQLNLGAIGILVPSLAELGSEEGNDPLLLVTRPAKPIDFTIGDGTEESPSLTLHLQEFSIDFYAFLFERYTRGFTVTLDADVGVNLEFTTDSEGNPAIVPMLTGLEADNIGVRVSNEEFLREDVATLESVFPTVLNLVLPLVTGALGEIAVPEVVGFQLDNLQVERVTTSQDDFLAIGASLGAGSMMRDLGEQFPSVAAMAENMAPTTVQMARGNARLVEVRAPSAEAMRAELTQGKGEKPSLLLDLDTQDASGRPLEWSWSIDGGLWRPFVSGGLVELSDPAFYWQGRYQIQLRSRAQGDQRSWSNVQSVEAVFDSVGPRILPSKLVRSESEVSAAAFDLVYGEDVELAFGSPELAAPQTAWTEEGRISLAEAEALAHEGVLRVFAKDPQGNQSHKDLRISDAPLAQVGGCSTGSSQSSWLALLVVGMAFLGRRKFSPSSLKAALLPSLVVAASAMTPACSCSGDPAGTTCTLDEECIDACPEGEVGQCFEEACRCLADIPYGKIGQYSSMDMADDGVVWVSAYNSTHGDLMVASTTDMGRIPNESWQFVDGVPEVDPVLPPSANRFGVRSEGPDVGKYSDIAVTGANVAMVSHFDSSQGSLKFTANYGGQWHSHVVDQGQLSDDDAVAGHLAGQYSAISLDANGIPAIAYFAHTAIGTDEATTEVRLAVANNAEPRSAADWTISQVDSAPVPATEDPDPLVIPLGTGLFIEMARDSAGQPVITYYDRVNGDLQVARNGTEGFVVETLVSEGDVGWYPSLLLDDEDILHVTYVDADNHDLMYVNDQDLTPVLVDDGYRIVGTTDEGLPLPEFHFVGDDSSLVLAGGSLYVTYQDATTHELLVATPNEDGTWVHTSVAGSEDPFVGAYGYFANSKFQSGNLTMSSWVINQTDSDAWVELFRRSIVIE